MHLLGVCMCVCVYALPGISIAVRFVLAFMQLLMIYYQNSNIRVIIFRASKMLTIKTQNIET